MRVSVVSSGEAPVGANSGDEFIGVPTRLSPTPKALPTAANNGVVSVATGLSTLDWASLLQTGQKGLRVVNH